MTDWEERVAELLEMTDEDPEDALAHFMLGQEYQRKKMWLEALPYFEVVLDLDPEYTAAYRGVGLSLRELGEVEEAKRSWMTGLEVADRTGDLQTGREMRSFLRRLGVEVD